MLNSTIQDSLMTKSAGFVRLGRLAAKSLGKFLSTPAGVTAAGVGSVGALAAPDMYHYVKARQGVEDYKKRNADSLGGMTPEEIRRAAITDYQAKRDMSRYAQNYIKDNPGATINDANRQWLASQPSISGLSVPSQIREEWLHSHPADTFGNQNMDAMIREVVPSRASTTITSTPSTSSSVGKVNQYSLF